MSSLCSAARSTTVDLSPRFVQRDAGDRRLGAPDVLRAEGLDLDDEAVAVFLRLGFFVGDDTPFRAIRAAGRPRVRPPRPHGLTRAQLVEAFAEMFRSAIRRRLPDVPYVLPLSGGRDSRHILLELHDAGRPPAAVVTVEHFPPRLNDDVKVAADLSTRLRLPHRVLHAARDRVTAEEVKNGQTWFCTDEHAQFLPLARYLRQVTPLTYDGIGGDVLSQSSYLNPDLLALFRTGNLEAAARFLLDGFGRQGLEQALAWLLGPDARRRFDRERAVSRLVRELRRHATAPNPVASFFFWNRTRREIALAPLGLLAPVQVHMPFLDQDLFDCLMATPAETLLGGRLHDDVLARRWPRLAEVPYAATRNDASNPAHHRRTARALLTRVLSGQSHLLNRRAVAARCVATAIDGHPGRLWFLPLVIWLQQVERLARDA